MFIHPMPKKVVPWSAIIIAVLLTIDFGHSTYQNYVEKTNIEQVIEHVNMAAAAEKQIKSQQQRSDKIRDKETKVIDDHDPYTLELEALGVKLKMINEATWNGIFKICFLWAFVLSSLIVYKRFIPK